MPKRKKSEDPRLKKLLKRRVAIHEAGHAVVAWFEPRLPKVKRAEVKKREQSLGKVVPNWKWRHSSLAEPETWHAWIRCLLGGLMAERLVFGQHTLGVYGDLYMASTTALEMVAMFGMNEKFGPVSVFGMANGPKNLDLIDAEVRKIVSACQKQVERDLKKRKQQVLAVAAGMIEQGTLKTKDLKKILGPRPKRIK